MTLDPHNADAHAAQSYLYGQRDWDWNRAELELKTAIAEDPGNSIGHRWYRYILHQKGRTEEALEQARLALKTDPASVTLIKIYASDLARDKHYTEAISTFKEALDFDPNDAGVHFGLADSYDKAGNLDLAPPELEKGYRLSGETEIADQFHRDLKRFGYQKSAEAARRFNLERQVRELKTKSALGNYVSPTAYVYVYADLHDKENTLKWLEAAYGADAHVMVELRDEKFDFVRQEPRFQKIWGNVPFSH
ncbi:tetratricopeptide repeat protein [Tunturiibacter gelidiferens]|uniref:tetratricopeptide repeat protein n=1 Tax=Tunturiibacter gelidiferens TaxID=3069689 RepID=UPI003D9BA317